MRKSLRSSAALLCLAAVGAIAFTLSFAGSLVTFAQEAQGAPPPPPGQHQGPGPGQGPRRHGPNPEFETRMLTRRLGLTADQAAKIEPILAAQNEQLKALRPQPGTQPGSGTPPDFKAMHEQRKAIMDQTRSQLDAILTPEQQAEFSKMHERRGPGGPGGPHGHPGGPHNGQPGSGE